MGGVRGDLGAKFFQTGKAALGSDPVDEVRAQPDAVEIAFEVEEVHFDARLERTACDGRAKPDVGDAPGECSERSWAFALAVHEDGVDAIGRKRLGDAIEVARGKADRPTAMIAVHHSP